MNSKQPLEFKVLRTLFTEIDKDGNGTLSRHELVEALKRLKLSHDEDDVDQLVARVKPKDIDAITFSEFAFFVTSREKEINDVFTTIDQDGNGLLSRSEIGVALDKVHMRYTAEELHGLFRRMDGNGDEQVSYDEFRNFVMLLPSVNIAAIWNSHIIHQSIDIGEDMTVPDDIRKQPDPWHILFAGGVAGAFSRTLTAPADRLKVIYQAGPVPQKGGLSASPSLASLSRQIYAEGGARAFFRGNGTNVLKIAPETGVKFFAYESLKEWICADSNNPVMHERFLSGAGAGAISQFAIYPMEIAKTRLALSERGYYTGVVDCLARTVRIDGIRGLYRGLVASVAGIIPYAGVDLMLYTAVRDAYTKRNPERKPGTMVILGAGAFSSVCGQVVAFPLQCCRTKLQAQGMKGRPILYSGLVDCFRKIIVNEGPTGLYRGILPNFMKAVPAISVSYVVFENVKSWVSKINM
eukprot:36247_1